MASKTDCRLLRSERGRWFFVPIGTPIPPGTFVVRTQQGRNEWLKEGTLALWEISTEFAELILADRARAAGQQTAELLGAMLGALGAREDEPEKILEVLARAASSKQEHRSALKRRLDVAIAETRAPEHKEALTQLQKKLLT